MRTGRPKAELTVTEEERRELDSLAKWRSRFIEGRMAGLLHEARPGAPRQITDEQVEDVIVRNLVRPRPRAPRTGAPGTWPRPRV